MNNFLNKNLDVGLLIIRLVVGFTFAWIGWAKLEGGVERWEGLGEAMSNFGITFAPAFWGFMASVSEFAGGLFLMLGLFHRVACVFVFLTMLVASISHFADGDSLSRTSNSMRAGAVYAGMFFTGPGKYSLDAWWANRKTQKTS